MIWHVIYSDQTGRVQSRAARSRDLAVHTACELLSQSLEVRRVIGPDGSTIEHDELEAHYDDAPSCNKRSVALQHQVAAPWACIAASRRAKSATST